MPEAFNATAFTVALASGQAVVYHRVVIMSMDPRIRFVYHSQAIDSFVVVMWDLTARVSLVQGGPMDYTSREAIHALVTVVETPQFIERAGRLLTPDQHDELIAFLAGNPAAGDLVAGTGGLRKLRWALSGRGKRGGARVIHFFYAGESIVFALAMFAKNERVDLSQQERNEFRQLTKILAATYRRPRP